MSLHIPASMETLIGAGLRPSSPLTGLLILATLLLLSYLAYQRALPKPVPGIAYNPAAARRVLGDLPDMWLAFATGDIRGWLCGLATRLDSPIVQILGRHSSRASLVITDFRTTQDILLHHTATFERPTFLRTAFRAMIPHHSIGMLTTDPQFRRNRALVKDLMTSPFLHSVNAPSIWGNALRFVELWRYKAAVAGGRPFDAAEDVSRMTFDIIKGAALGKADSTLIALYLEKLQDEYGSGGGDRTKTSAGDQGEGAPFPFPKPPDDEVLEAQHRMNTAISKTSMIPAKLFHAMNKLRPSMREAFAWKEKMLKKQVDLAVKRMEADEPLESALDYMIQREIVNARNEGRPPVFDSPIMHDELYGYIGAGHDTTATTFLWGLKHLTLDPEIQTKARQNLREVYADAHAQHRQPTVTEIIDKHAPYLDAVIEEVLRLSGPVPAIVRTTTADTVIMGHDVPKSTPLFLAFYGASFTSPSVGSGTEERKKSAPAPLSSYTYTKRDNWDGMEPEAFIPDRWLVQGADGRMEFDAHAGPMLAFSLGTRGCFGRRLAYLTLRMLYTLLLWNLEFRPVPDELSSWKAVAILTRKPTQCYVRVAEAR